MKDTPVTVIALRLGLNRFAVTRRINRFRSEARQRLLDAGVI